VEQGSRIAKLRRRKMNAKVPATLEGLQSTRLLIGEGININVTLLLTTVRFPISQRSVTASVLPWHADARHRNAV